MDLNLRRATNSRMVDPLLQQLTQLDSMERTLSTEISRHQIVHRQLRAESAVLDHRALSSFIEEHSDKMESMQATLRDLRESVQKTINICSRKPVTILDMPDEILVKVFEIDKKSIKNVRLTCRDFCRTSSHLLLHTVNVCMTDSSLARLQQIASHPTIATGVRAIRFNPAFYSSELAENIGRFAATSAERLRYAASAYQPQVKAMRMHPFDADDYYELSGAIQEINNMADDWEKYEATLQQDPMEASPLSEDKEWSVALLLQAHERYQQRRDAQQRLLQDRALVQSIAAAMAKMPRASRLVIDEQPTLLLYWDGRVRRDYAKWVLPSPERLLDQELAWPHSWREAKELGIQDIPTELLVALPVAIRRSGASLMELRINLSSLSGIPSTVDETQLRNLEGATSSLKVCDIRIPNPSILRKSDEVERLHAFISAATHARSIERLCISL